VHNEHLYAEKKIIELLKSRNYSVHVEPLIAGKYRPDLVFEKDNKKYVVEIKTLATIQLQTVYQILQYIIRGDFDGGYLAILEGTKIPHQVKEELIKNGIGIIQLGREKLELDFVKKADDRSKIIHDLVPKDTKKIFDKLSTEEGDKLVEGIYKKIVDIFDKSQEKREIEDFPMQVFIFIIVAAIIGSSLWFIIENIIGNYLLGEYQLLVAFIIFIISLLILVGYFIIKKRKYKNSKL